MACMSVYAHVNSLIWLLPSSFWESRRRAKWGDSYKDSSSSLDRYPATSIWPAWWLFDRGSSRQAFTCWLARSLLLLLHVLPLLLYLILSATLTHTIHIRTERCSRALAWTNLLAVWPGRRLPARSSDIELVGCYSGCLVSWLTGLLTGWSSRTVSSVLSGVATWWSRAS